MTICAHLFLNAITLAYDTQFYMNLFRDNTKTSGTQNIGNKYILYLLRNKATILKYRHTWTEQ